MQSALDFTQQSKNLTLRTRSSIFCLSVLICSSFNASWSFGYRQAMLSSGCRDSSLSFENSQNQIGASFGGPLFNRLLLFLFQKLLPLSDVVSHVGLTFKGGSILSSGKTEGIGDGEEKTSALFFISRN